MPFNSQGVSLVKWMCSLWLLVLFTGVHVAPCVGGGVDGVSVTVSVNPEVVSSQPQELQLSCEYPGISPPHQVRLLTWHFGTVLVYGYDAAVGVTIAPDYEGRIHHDAQPGSDSMRISLLDAELCDAGTYTCAVYDTNLPPNFGNNNRDVFQQDVQLHWGEIGAESCVTCGDGNNVITVKAGEVDKLSCMAFYSPSLATVFTWDTEYSGTSITYSLPNADGCNTSSSADVNALEVKVDEALNGIEFVCEVTFGDGRMLTSEKVMIIVDRVAPGVGGGVDGAISVTVSVHPEVVSSQPQKLELTCEYPGINPPYQLGYLACYFGTELIYSFLKDQGVTIGPGYEDRIEQGHLSNDSMKLWLLDAELCDAGTYTCTAYDDNLPPDFGSDEVDVYQQVVQIHWGEIGAESCVTCGDGDNVIIVDKGDVDKLHNLSCMAFYSPSSATGFIWDTKYSGNAITYSLPNADGCNTGSSAEVNALEVNVTVADMMEFVCEVTFGDGTVLRSENVTIIVDTVEPAPESLEPLTELTPKLLKPLLNEAPGENQSLEDTPYDDDDDVPSK